MSEIARAHQLGMEQSLKCYSVKSVSVNKTRLKEIKVENMKASRKEDVEYILMSIPDKALFNRHLQHILFDTKSGLFAAWTSLNGTQQMNRVGRLCGLLDLSCRSRLSERGE